LYNKFKVQTRTIGVEGLYSNRNLPESIVSLISYGLTINSDNDKPLPSPLVESIETVNDDQNYIFHLKHDVYWNNGVHFRSQDINYPIKGAQTKVIDDYTFQISLEKPFAPILSSLSRPLYYKDTLIGLGPYMVSNNTYQDGYYQTITLKSSDQKQIVQFRFYGSENDLFTAFKLGEVDEINISNLPDGISKWQNIKITPKIDTQKYIAIFLNTEKIGIKQVRQALSYATPKTKDKNERCVGPISPGSWAYNSDVKEYDFNPQRAKDLLGNEPVPSLNLLVGDRKLLPMSDSIKSAWKDTLNINVNVSAEIQDTAQNYDAILTYSAIPHDPDQYLFWHSTQTQTNITKLNNSRIDKLLEDGRVTFDNQERKKIYLDFQKFLLEESPAIFISYPTTFTLSRIK
jgi:peptide/nickel transport system substrate-binding protein